MLRHPGFKFAIAALLLLQLAVVDVLANNTPVETTLVTNNPEDFEGYASVPCDWGVAACPFASWESEASVGTGTFNVVSCTNFGSLRCGEFIDNVAATYNYQLRNSQTGYDLCQAGQSFQVQWVVPTGMVATQVYDLRFASGAPVAGSQAVNTFGLTITGQAGAELVTQFHRGSGTVVTHPTTFSYTPGTTNVVTMTFRITGCTSTTPIFCIDLTGALSATNQCLTGTSANSGDFDRFSVMTSSTALPTPALRVDNYHFDGAPLPAPTVTSISPARGTTEGGLAVTITGTGFKATPAVTIGGTAATSVALVSATKVTATTPPHTPAGLVNVVVTNPDGQSATLTNGFRYDPLPQPILTVISPNNGPKQGGTLVNVTGQNFRTGFTATFDNVPAVDPVFVSATKVQVTSPPGTVGPVSFQLCNADGACDAKIYTYREPTSEETGGGGGTGGADTVLTGTNTADSGKYSDIAVVGDTVVIAHSVGAAYQLVLSISQDGGDSFAQQIPSGYQGVIAERLAIIDEQSWAVAFHGTCACILSTRDAGATAYTAFAFTVDPGFGGLTTSGPIDIDAVGNTYIATQAWECNSGSSCGGGSGRFTMVQVAKSNDKGLTWTQQMPAGGRECGESGQLGYLGYSTVQAISSSSWVLAYYYASCDSLGRILGFITTNSGASYDLLPGQTTSTLNDPLNPLSAAGAGYGHRLQWDHDQGNYFTFLGPTGKPMLAKRDVSGQFLFTEVSGTAVAVSDTTGIGPGTGAHGQRPLRIEASGDVVILSWIKSGDTAKWYQFAWSGDGAVITTETPILGDPTAKPYANAGLEIACPSFYESYQDPSSGILKVQRISRGVGCDDTTVQGPLDAEASVAVTNLVGFDVDNTGATIVGRYNNGNDVSVWNGANLAQGPVVDTDCTARLTPMVMVYHSPANGQEYVGFTQCASSSNVDVFSIRSSLLGDPDFTVGGGGQLECSVIGCPQDIEDQDIASPEDDLYELASLSTYPINYIVKEGADNTCQSARFAFGYSTTDGKLGVVSYTANGGLHCSGTSDTDVSKTTSVQLAATAGSVEQICTARDQEGEFVDGETSRDFIYGMSVGSSGGVVKGYRVVYTENDRNPRALTMALSPVFTGGPNTYGALAIGCAQDRILVVTSGGEAKLFTIGSPEVKVIATGLTPVQLGAALDPTGNFGAYVNGNRIQVFRVSDGVIIGNLTAPATGTLRGLKFSDLAQALFVATSTGLSRYNTGSDDVADTGGIQPCFSACDIDHDNILDGADGDLDNDGIPNEEDLDVDGDGKCNGATVTPPREAVTTTKTEAEANPGRGHGCVPGDLDNDGDGISNNVDPDGSGPDSTQITCEGRGDCDANGAGISGSILFGPMIEAAQHIVGSAAGGRVLIALLVVIVCALLVRQAFNQSDDAQDGGAASAAQRDLSSVRAYLASAPAKDLGTILGAALGGAVVLVTGIIPKEWAFGITLVVAGSIALKMFVGDKTNG